MSTKESGERQLQVEMRSSDRAQRFYDRQMHDFLTGSMIFLIRRQEIVFIATADLHGNCDCSPRFGNPGFVLVLDKKILAYPEYRGNGVYASLGNILENPHIGMVFVDFFDTTVGLHVNGQAHSYPISKIPGKLKAHLEQFSPPCVTAVERWVVVTIDEAYIHCSKHVPRLAKMDKSIQWGTDDPSAKSSDFFVGPSGKR
ncbi:MAG: pyridoxamine 5-phosphate oxidase [Phycisphaeraceae bacterium]|nr:pyridoxamine 5-phosphate oxidase [Phycisphaeraceae bacterium]